MQRRSSGPGARPGAPSSIRPTLRGGIVAALVVCAATTAAARAELTILGGTGTGGSNPFTLVEIDPASGATTPVGGFGFWTGLDFSPDGSTLYGVNDELVIIDPAAGPQTVIGPLTYNGSTPILMKSATVSPQGEIFVLSNQASDPAGVSRLFTVDPLSGDLSLVGTPDAIVFGIEFAPDGTLFAAFTSLFVLDPGSGSTIADLGALGSGAAALELDFTPQGELLGIDPQLGSANLFSLDPIAGPGNIASLLTHIPDDAVRSIASIPAPGAVTLLGAWWAFGTPRTSRRRRPSAKPAGP